MVIEESSHGHNHDSQASAVTLGLSQNLAIPITVKLRLLETQPPQLATGSMRYKDANVFKKLSEISANSPMFVQVQLFDGRHSAITDPYQTPHVTFKNNTRTWNRCVKLPVNYSQAAYDAYLEFTLLEIVCTRPEVVGRGHLSLFNHTDSTLRKGAYKVLVYHGKGDACPSIDYTVLAAVSPTEAEILRFESGTFSGTPWLEKWGDSALRTALKQIAAEEEKNTSSAADSAPFRLFVELPDLRLPVVFLDTHCAATSTKTSQDLAHITQSEPMPPKATIINLLEIPAGQKGYDPDFHAFNLEALSSTLEQPAITATSTGQLAAVVNDPARKNPIEQKYHSLAINISNNTVLDKTAKPAPHVRDELWRILRRPSGGALHPHERELLWKFRYYFSSPVISENQEEITTAAPLQTARQFFTKFLRCFDWENEHELDHAFLSIVPLWRAEMIDVGDALELVSSTFNPYTLTAALRRRMIATTRAINAPEETKIAKIFACTRRLRNLAVARLRLASPEELRLYLLQLVQALKYEPVADGLVDAPLALFLLERAVESASLGNYFYWYVKVENEDQLRQGAAESAPENTRTGVEHTTEANGAPRQSIYNIVLNLYIERLKAHSLKNRLPQYRHLKSQIAFVKKLTGIVELLRNTFKKGDATQKKAQFLREHLADAANGMLRFAEPFPLPLDPAVIVCGCYPQESAVFKSSLAPLKITFKTVKGFGSENGSASLFGARKLYGKYPLMFKIGDDLRQDQLVIQIINLMDQLLKNENLNLKLTPYKILATSPIAGLIQFIPNETLDVVLSKNYADPESAGRDSRSRGSIENAPKNGILTYLQHHSRLLERDDIDEGSILGVKKDPLANQSPQHAIATDLGVSSEVMDNYVKSCAGYCVITYILGVGDRHLDNLLLSPNGKFWHADFGYILGRDPKPFPPMMKLPIQVIDGMGGMNHENFDIFKSYCFITYTTLRRNSNLILNLFQLMLDANIPDIQIDPKRAVEKVQDKFNLEMSEEEAILHFQNLIIDSVNAFLPVVIDTLHSLAQYWRA